MAPAKDSSAKPSRTAWHKLNVKLSKEPWVHSEDGTKSFYLSRSPLVVSLWADRFFSIENHDGLSLHIDMYQGRLSYKQVHLDADEEESALPFHYVPKEFLTVLRLLFGDKWVEGLIKYKYNQALKPWRKLLKEHCVE